MKITHRSKAAVALVACLTLTALAGCGQHRAGSASAPTIDALPEAQSVAGSSDVVRAIDVEEVRNYHLSIHG